MKIIIKFNESAFRHGISREDIEHAIKTRVYDAPIIGFINKYALIGFDATGNPLEIMYNPVDDDTIYVFHAMKARKTFLAMLDL